MGPRNLPGGRSAATASVKVPCASPDGGMCWAHLRAKACTQMKLGYVRPAPKCCCARGRERQTGDRPAALLRGPTGDAPCCRGLVCWCVVGCPGARSAGRACSAEAGWRDESSFRPWEQSVGGCSRVADVAGVLRRGVTKARAPSSPAYTTPAQLDGRTGGRVHYGRA